MRVRVAAILLFILLPAELHAQDTRIALLIGNTAYKAGVGSLINPLNDVRVVDNALKTVGFEVLKPVKNAQRSAMLMHHRARPELDRDNSCQKQPTAKACTRCTVAMLPLPTGVSDRLLVAHYS
jgi:hypothetical protein